MKISQTAGILAAGFAASCGQAEPTENSLSQLTVPAHTSTDTGLEASCLRSRLNEMTVDQIMDLEIQWTASVLNQTLLGAATHASFSGKFEDGSSIYVSFDQSHKIFGVDLVSLSGSAYDAEYGTLSDLERENLPVLSEAALKNIALAASYDTHTKVSGLHDWQLAEQTRDQIFKNAISEISVMWPSEETVWSHPGTILVEVGDSVVSAGFDGETLTSVQVNHNYENPYNMYHGGFIGLTESQEQELAAVLTDRLTLPRMKEIAANAEQRYQQGDAMIEDIIKNGLPERTSWEKIREENDSKGLALQLPLGDDIKITLYTNAAEPDKVVAYIVDDKTRLRRGYPEVVREKLFNTVPEELR